MKKNESVVDFNFRDKQKEDLGLQRLAPLFKENQLSVLSLIQQKKSLIPRRNFDSLVKSISTVTLGSFDDPEVKSIFAGACSRPNAIYYEKTHRVYICPNLLSYPDNTLKQILAHELGHVIQKMQKHIPCFKEYPKNQVNEAFADWVASKVLSEKIAHNANPGGAAQQVLESQLLFLSLACAPNFSKHDWAHSHPDLKNRIEKIFLSQPTFQEAFRCHAENDNSCG